MTLTNQTVIKILQRTIFGFGTGWGVSVKRSVILFVY